MVVAQPMRLISSLTQALDLSEGSVVYGQTVAADQYLYLVAQDTDDGTYSTGKLMITIVGQAS